MLSQILYWLAELVTFLAIVAGSVEFNFENGVWP